MPVEAVAVGTGLLKDSPAVTRIGLRQSLGRQLGLPAVDGGLLVGGRVTQLAPDFGQVAGQCLVSKATNLAGLCRREIGARDLALADVLEESRAKLGRAVRASISAGRSMG